MITLAFDTALDKMYVTLKKDSEILTSEVVETTETKYHSAYLISTIEEVLNRHNLKPADVDLIGINIGPGSFTGIRACTTVARIMAQQLNIKVVGVSSLEILSKINKTDKPSLATLDARKNSAYLLVNNEIKGAVPIEELKKIIESKDYFVITDNKLQPVTGGVSYQQNSYPLGEILAELAEIKINEVDGDWRKLLPLYIQPAAVHMTKK